MGYTLLTSHPSHTIRKDWSVPWLSPDSEEVTQFAVQTRKLESLPLFNSDGTGFSGLKLRLKHSAPPSTHCNQKKKLSSQELWQLLYSDSPQLEEDSVVSLDASLLLLDDLGKLCKDGQLHSALSALDIMDERGLYVSIDILSCLLQKCMDKADHTAGRKLHCLLIRLGHDTEGHLASGLVHMYLLCGSLLEALQAFSKLPTANAFLWSAVILAHTRLGSNHQALKLYHQMQEFGVSPDGHTLVFALKACSGLASLDQGRLLHCYIVQRGLGSDVFVVSTLIDMYSNSGSIEDGQRVFEATPNRNIVTWNAIIKGHVEHGLGPKALRFYHQMHQQGVEADRITFISILKACSGVSSTDQGRSIHQQVIEKGFDLDSLVIARLVDMYGNTGNLTDARTVFEKGPKQDLGIWNAMIATYSQNEHTVEALHLLKGLQQTGLEATGSIFICLLKGIGQVVSLEQGELVHGHIIEMGLDKDLQIMNTLITMYAKCASLKDACRVFDSLPMLDLVTWNAIIGAHTLHEQGLQALQLFHQLQKGGWKPNWSTLSASLKACSIVGAINEGLLIHSTIIEGSLELDVMVMNNLIDMYIKCGSFNDAIGVFDSLTYRDVVTWTTAISGCVQHCHDAKALRLFQEMQEDGVLPNQVTFVNILKACRRVSALDQGKLIHNCVIGRGLDSDITIINTLIDMYANCGSLEDGRKVFDYSPRRDVVTWTAMIDALVQHESGPEAILLFTRMQQEGMEPDRAAFLNAFKACSSVAALSQGKLIHMQSIKRGLSLDNAIVNSLIDMYMKCGSLQDAQRVFKESLTRDVVTWTSMIAGCARHHNYHLALHYFQDMQNMGITPNDVTFLSLLSACSHLGLRDQGLFHLKLMISLGIPPFLEHLTCIAEVLAHTGNLDAAEDVFETSPFRLDMAGWMCLLPHCRRHGNLGMGRRCFDYLAKMDCRNAAGYILMANMYVAAGLWESAASIEELRQCANAWKKAGKAFIEIENQVHEFIGGNKVIPEIDAKLGQLAAQMKERGYTPAVDQVLQSTSDEEKESILCGHCEKQAIVFGLLNTSSGASIRVSKNLRMCADCHNAAAAISQIEMREITVADEHCIHLFKDGICSCKFGYG